MGILSSRIDVAAIDAVTLALLQDRYPGAARALSIIDWTPPSPSLPLITAARPSDHVRDPNMSGTHCASACRRSSPIPATPPLLQRLRITGVSMLAHDGYQPLLAMVREAMALGYPVRR